VQELHELVGLAVGDELADVVRDRIAEFCDRLLGGELVLAEDGVGRAARLGGRDEALRERPRLELIAAAFWRSSST
jgi:hypothetical protein